MYFYLNRIPGVMSLVHGYTIEARTYPSGRRTALVNTPPELAGGVFTNEILCCYPATYKIRLLSGSYISLLLLVLRMCSGSGAESRKITKPLIDYLQAASRP